MHDFFEKFSQEEDKKSRNLKGFSVKLPEDIIEEIEKLHSHSGLKYKNEFIEFLIQQYKVNLFKEGNLEEGLLHPEIVKHTSGDMYQLAKLTRMINELFVKQLEKVSMEQYNYERLQKEYKEIKETNTLPSHEHIPKTFLNEYLHTLSKKQFGHSLYVGSSGSGKSHATKLAIKQALQEGKQVIVLENQKEYKRFAERKGGIHIPVGHKNAINVFEISSHRFYEDLNYMQEKVLFVHEAIEKMIKRNISGVERAALLDAIAELYEEHGVYAKKLSKSYSNPTLKELTNKLKENTEAGVYIADELSPYTEGVFEFVGKERNFQIRKAPIIVFDLHEIEYSTADSMLMIVLKFIEDIVHSHIFEDILFVIDESYGVHSDETIAKHFGIFLKDSRKFNLDCVVSTQCMTEGVYPTFLSWFGQIYHFRLSSKKDVSWISYLDETTKENIHTLKVGESLVYLQTEDTQFRLQFPYDEDASSDPIAFQNDILY